MKKNIHAKGALKAGEIDLLNAIRLSKQAVMNMRIREFAEESNRIEGIDDQDSDFDAENRLKMFLKHDKLTIENVCKFNTAGKLRDKLGMDVRIGDYLPPAGGPDVKERLKSFLNLVSSTNVLSPLQRYIAFEQDHPFMDGNGRTGRAIWLWIMVNQNSYDISLGFLRKLHYQIFEQ